MPDPKIGARPPQEENPTPENRDSYFVSFDVYKNSGGEMSAEDYRKVQLQKGDLKSAFYKIKEVTGGIPDTKMTSVFAKIDSLFPGNGPRWVYIETCLAIGHTQDNPPKDES